MESPFAAWRRRLLDAGYCVPARKSYEQYAVLCGEIESRRLGQGVIFVVAARTGRGVTIAATASAFRPKGASSRVIIYHNK